MTPDNEVTVQLSGAPEDAETVFGALRTAFACDRSPDERPRSAGAFVTVWTATFDTSDEHGESAAPVPLGSPVTAELYGAHAAVDRVAKELASVFAVHQGGTVPGEHEEELHLRLETRG